MADIGAKSMPCPPLGVLKYQNQFLAPSIHPLMAPSSAPHAPLLQVDLDRLLLCQGLDLASLRDPACQPVTREQLDRRQRVRQRGCGGLGGRVAGRSGRVCAQSRGWFFQWQRTMRVEGG